MHSFRETLLTPIGRARAYDCRAMHDLLDRLADPALIVRSDGSIERANPALSSLLGCRETALRGTSFERLVPRHQRARHAAHWEAMVAANRPRRFAAAQRMEIRHEDGHGVPVEVSFTPLGDRHEGAFLVLFHEIGDRLAVEHRAKLSDAVLAGTGTAVMVTDIVPRVVLVNEAFTRLTGWAPAEVIGENPRFLGSGVHGAELWHQMWAQLHEGRSWRGELVNARRDGSRYVTEQTITPIQNEAGAVTHYVAVMQDVTARTRETTRLSRQLEQLRVLHELSRLGARASSAAQFALAASETVRARLHLTFCTIDPEARDVVEPHRAGRIERRLEAGGVPIGRLVAHHDGPLSPETAMLLEAVCGQLTSILHTLATIDGLRTRASIDALTVLANRGALIERGNLELERAQRYARPLSVILLDVDRFKGANDEHGHAFGDEVLRVVAGYLSRERRKTDLGARYGGDELVLLMPETDAAAARTVAERLRALIAGHRWSIPDAQITASFGVASLDGHATLAELLADADRALYAAKHHGRDRVETVPALPRATS